MKKSNTILKNILILFCPFLILSACSKNKPTIPVSNVTTGAADTLQSNQTRMENLSCDNLPNLEIINDDIEIPKSVGQYVDNCHESPNYNACIYDGNPFLGNSNLKDIFDRITAIEDEWPFVTFAFHRGNTYPQLWEDIKEVHQDFNETMSLYQTYGINITGTTGGLLKNEHYNVTVNPEEFTQRIRQLPSGKWTQPYTNQVVFGDEYSYTDEYNYNLEQIMVYYYLMYQKEWMELNTGKWYASGKNISVIVNHEGRFLSRSLWNRLQNRIGLRWSYLIGRTGTVLSQPNSNNYSSAIRLLKIGRDAMNPSIIAHEAGHANFDYSTDIFSRMSSQLSQREGLCGKPPFPPTCCINQDGCIAAINEGQADFHALMPFPNIPIIFDFKEDPETTTSTNVECHTSRDPQDNKTLTAKEAFNCDTEDNTKGEIHNMGALYASIWWEIYDREDTSKKDIATLFTEHLPLASESDTFRTVAFKVIGKAIELFDGPKGEHYACIISQEFTKRGLSPIEEAAE